MFNFCSEIEKTVPHKEKTEKYEWIINFTNLVLLCRKILLLDYSELPAIGELISKVVSPVRPGRTNPRIKRRQRKSTFNYKIR